jgi:hypothetical protein
MKHLQLVSFATTKEVKSINFTNTTGTQTHMQKFVRMYAKLAFVIT